MVLYVIFVFSSFCIALCQSEDMDKNLILQINKKKSIWVLIEILLINVLLWGNWDGGNFIIIDVKKIIVGIPLNIINAKLIGKCFISRKPFAMKNMFNIGLFLLVPIIGVYLLEYITNTNVALLSIGTWFINIFIVYIAYFFVWCISGSFKITEIICLITCLVLGSANYFVVQFRDIPIMISDISSIKTAFSVSGNYKFEFTPEMKNAAIVCGAICILVILGTREYKKSLKQRISWLGCGAILGGITVNMFNTYSITSNYKIGLDNFTPKNTYNENGFFMSAVAFAQHVKVSKPSGYVKRIPEQILDKYLSYNDVQGVRPNIIVVMNESFSDLNVLGNMDQEEEMLPFYNSLKKNTVKGNAYVSVRGGNTCNSEFEFLTGFSMGNMSGASIPYMQYDLSEIPNLVSTLKEQGYETAAIHPFKGTGWKRNRVYNDFGFDHFWAENDFESPERIRDFISDRSSYEKIIEAFEKKEDKIFIFNVTMQNHGGYDWGYLKPDMDFPEITQQYPDVKEYLSLINESDSALGELISYFSNITEPTVICFFGDHQPNLNAEFINKLMGIGDSKSLTLEDEEKKYMVPYLIWANYDIEESIEDISLNYLGAKLLEIAGVERTPFDHFLLDMRNQLPIYNRFGYADANGNFHLLNPQDNEWIKTYQMLQYYLMFDKQREQKYYSIGGETK